jgi:hypothetical protein
MRFCETLDLPLSFCTFEFLPQPNDAQGGLSPNRNLAVIVPFL